MSVTLQGLTHSYPDDIDILLTGPGGQLTLLMSDAGGTFPLNNLVITLVRMGRQLPNSTQITSGVYGPSNWGGTLGDTFPPPAPAGPYSSSFEEFDGVKPNGTWSLYVRDDIPENSGVIADGWSITITTGPEPPPVLSALQNGSSVELFWPTNFTGFSLESHPRWETMPTWSPVTNAVAVTNGNYRVVVLIGSDHRFFRLRR